ncbi:aromatic ring-opening dioxygenase LigA [Georgenia sp. SYP-B2076]|uniref:aromatic ring-opening dioxygenase LigA n=1 Tax=Georgenia sp. SYP-B2076 TaxID=2495881 RepID=UPI000F8E6BE6|nr:aromatic ring-opening dioxygenase LigA [Georgenia sp. SYP-B2076]
MKSAPAKITGIIAIIAGIVFIVAGGVTWGMISSQLSDQKITVSEDSPMLPGDTVDGPFSAYAQAGIINTHALKATEGKTYAELGAAVNAAKESGDTAAAEELQTQRNTVMNASFLRASLFTSVVAYGVAALVMGLGVVLILVGWAFNSLSAAAPMVVAPTRERVNA